MKKILAFASTAIALTAAAETLENQSGFKIGERMTLRPTVSVSASYDSDVGAGGGPATRTKRRDFFWSISPTLSIDYNGETWSMMLGGYYNYHQYFDNENRNYDNQSFGQSLRLNWASSDENGWSFILGESFSQVCAADDVTLYNGRGYSDDSRSISLSAGLSHNFSERVHAGISGSTSNRDFLNNDSVDQTRYSYYGWGNWSVGASVGYTFSPWSDVSLSGSYGGYKQDNVSRLDGISDSSQSYSVSVGIGTRATERISYNVNCGWSCFEYGDCVTDNGFTYSVSANWKIGETWNTMLMASSNYQPSERQANSRSRFDSVSWALSKSMIRGKLTASCNVQYHRETQNYALDRGKDNDYVLNIVTAGMSLSYSLCRYASVFGACNYQTSMNDHDSSRRGAYDYDRLMLSVGLSFSY